MMKSDYVCGDGDALITVNVPSKSGGFVPMSGVAYARKLESLLGAHHRQLKLWQERLTKLELRSQIYRTAADAAMMLSSGLTEQRQQQHDNDAQTVRDALTNLAERIQKGDDMEGEV